MTTTSATTPDRAMQRVRHELRFRVLDVVRIQKTSAHMLRITLGGADLEGFHSPGFGDHVKLIFPDPATGELVRPSEDGPRPTMRDYTPLNYNAQALTLDIDFALHDAGPATAWALQAQVGQRIGVGGPRGSLLIPTNFDGHLLVGDDTALPAISRRLLELPAGAPVVVLAEVDGPDDELQFKTAADLTVVWAHRQGRTHGSQLLEALRTLELPAGDIFAWVACESTAAKAARSLLVERGQPTQWIKAAGYWRLGSADSHESIEG